MSGRQRKAYSRHVKHIGTRYTQWPRWLDTPISFGPEDAEEIKTPHHDALIVIAMISGVEIHWVFIDGGNSADILFQSTLEVMGILPSHVSGASSALHGFGGTGVKTLGQIELPVTFRDGEKTRTEEIMFDVVDMDYPYNVILGRASLNKFGAVPYHAYLCIKIPTREGVITVKGDQALSCELYGGAAIGRKEVTTVRRREELQGEDR